MSDATKTSYDKREILSFCVHNATLPRRLRSISRISPVATGGITSGSDTWWRSTDCQSEPSDMVVLLTAGQTVSSASPLTWDRTRSAVGTCDDETRPRAPGGGASYHLAVEIGGVAATETTQFLLY